MALPLEDVRVIDLTAARAGPTAVRQLADWGADVIRVEPPLKRAADIGNRHGSDFQQLHRNKRSLTLDLKSDRGRETLLELVKRSDVVVENMRPGVKHRLGVDYEACDRVNPRIVYASLSGFGQDGPHAARGGVDQIAQGMAGLMSVTGEPGRGPMRAGVPIVDLASGLYLAIGVLVALHERQRTGRGRWVQTSLLEAGIAMLDFQATRWTTDGDVPEQEGNHHPTAIPMGCFATSDGHVNIAAWDGPGWKQFCQAIGAPKLLDDPRYASPESRSHHRATLNDSIAERLAARTTAEWVATFDAAGLPAGPVYSVDQVFADPQVRHLDLVQALDTPAAGVVHLIRNPISISGHSRAIREPTPEVGAHTDEVLAEIGLPSQPPDAAGKRPAG